MRHRWSLSNFSLTVRSFGRPAPAPVAGPPVPLELWLQGIHHLPRRRRGTALPSVQEPLRGRRLG